MGQGFFLNFAGENGSALTVSHPPKKRGPHRFHVSYMAVRDTIEIIDGVHSGTTRLSLKTQLERFGDIDICHKIGDPREDTPWVRFRDASAALAALDAIARGEVLIDGVPIKAQWRGRKKEPPGFKSGARTSRDIYLEQQRARGGRSQHVLVFDDKDANSFKLANINFCCSFSLKYRPFKTM
eukprot:s2510_g8.t1